MDCITLPELADWAKVAAAAFAGYGLIQNSRRIAQSTLQRRVGQVSDVFLRLYDDKDVRKLYYRIEYGKFDYDKEKFPGSEDEENLDRLLGLFDTLAKLWHIGFLRPLDFDLIAYEFLQVYRNESVRAYMRYLDGEFAESGVGLQPYRHFRRLSEELLGKTSGAK